MPWVFLKWPILGGVFTLAFYLITALYLQREFVFALLFLVLTGSAIYIFASQRAYKYRYVYPAVAGMGLFVIFPLFYTVGIGFTNYSASNLLSQERVTDQLLAKRYQKDEGRFGFELYETPGGVIAYLENGTRYVSPPLPLNGGDFEEPVMLEEVGVPPAGDALGLRTVIRNREALKQLTLTKPDGTPLELASLRSFASLAPVYSQQDNGSLVDNRTGELYFPNQESGFFENGEGERLTPGWAVTIGFDNYMRVLTDPSISGPFMKIFIWTFTFAGLTVLFTFILGLVLASLLQWDRIGAKGFYRTMLILPYAVPAFISILVFKGLFNQNFGEINLVLENLFGARPDWFSDPALARTMILIVNTWLGYPYMMLLSMGLLQAIPRDLYEASAMDGAGPIDNLFRITLPMIIKPMMPLMIASFAFNFNNFVLIALLTGGAPDIIGASTPAGTTDLLVSYTYRIAFQDSGQNFGLAAAIATIIFLLVGTLSLINLKLSKVKV
ncbi:maltose ABC transporter permease MalF [Marinobacter lacisalsi]|uniref:Maltose/maltodextrin transport system permease protein n=1 Tax=Marinobacter lacisalsi TaxID=475979 RepID=A0ABV8QII4_9GAMM